MLSAALETIVNYYSIRSTISQALTPPCHSGSRGGSARGRGAAQSRGSKRRRADTNEQNQCEACHGDHPLTKCYYAFPEKAYNRWTPNPGMKALVRHKISITPDLKEKIERFQKRQKQDDDQE